MGPMTPQTWGDSIRGQMVGMEFKANELPPLEWPSGGGPCGRLLAGSGIARVVDFLCLASRRLGLADDGQDVNRTHILAPERLGTENGLDHKATACCLSSTTMRSVSLS